MNYNEWLADIYTSRWHQEGRNVTCEHCDMLIAPDDPFFVGYDKNMDRSGGCKNCVKGRYWHELLRYDGTEMKVLIGYGSVPYLCTRIS